MTRGFLGCGLAAALLGACAGGINGRWVGMVTPDAAGCRASRGVLVAESSRFVFNPSEGVITLRGTISPTGDMEGVYQTLDPDHHPVVFRFDGKLSGKQIQGVLTQPGCRASVALQPG